MRYIRLHEQVKVPIFKNVIYGLSLVWKADKKFVICHFLEQFAHGIFVLFIQNILFLKTLLSVIDSNGKFEDYIKSLSMFVVVSILLKAVSWYSNYGLSVSTKVVLKKLNNQIFDKAISLDVGCYEDPSFYDKYQRATTVLSSSYYDYLCSCVASAAANIVSLIMVITTVSIIDPMYLLFLVPVTLVFAIELIKSKLVYKRDLEMTTNNRIKAYIQRTVFLKDFSKDMRTSNIFAVMMVRFKAAIESNIVILKKYGIKLFIYSMVSSLFSDFIPTIGTYAFAAYQFVFTKALSVSSFSVVLSSINSVSQATVSIASNFDSMSQMALFFHNLREFFEYEQQVVSGDKIPGKLETLEFKNVSFRYPTAKKNSINNVSFKINAGETLALVGVNGAGKSTLVKLLLRFYDCTEGEILYNGVNIKEYDLQKYREVFGAVFQDYKNFAVSVYENILCRVCSDEDKEFAKKALKQSGIWDKIKTMPLQGDTVLTREFEKDGVGLSGGENQKVSVARLFAKEFELAILDEPSSALDPIAEYNMYENLIKITKDKTVLYISHRLSSAVLSDKIIVLGDGSVLEIGTHEELMENGGKYSEMFRLQASSYNRKEDEE